MRWYSSWTLLAAFAPVIVVYVVLIAYSVRAYMSGDTTVYQNLVGKTTLIAAGEPNSSDTRRTILKMHEDIKASFTALEREESRDDFEY